MEALRLTKVVKRYGHKPALHNVTIEVAVGEIYGFLGPNGAGKTTTIRCILDFIRPNAGRITVFGKDAQQNSVEVKRLIGYLSADSQLYAKWTAAEHIRLVASVRGAGRKRAANLAERLALDLSKPVRHMSSGNQQKLGLILALMSQPKLLILDEPTRGLDPLLQHEIYTILKEYVADGGTVFLSSHNLAEVERICTNVGVIRNGKMVASKSMDDIRSLKTHIVSVVFNKPVAAASLVAPRATLVSHTPDQATWRVQGDINPLLAAIAKHQVQDLEVTHAPLEEIFMDFYRGPK